ncbi:hypothetical protein F2Q69_00008077 [Brassica cretica]|uniref:Uncharacterized protein n=1 Tax=Brassica cretica TaxID=69181 RepID=A0A8S9PGS8_BRACR|nr:hypothetical protein F2Q69_00008077 [Brassica cretica]
MNTRHAEGQVDMEVSSGMAREHATGHLDAHVSPRMRPEACRTTHMRSGGSFLLAGNFYIYPATLVHFYSLRHTKDTTKRGLEREGEREREREKEVRCFRSIDIFRRPINCREVPKDCPEEKKSSFRVLISPDQFIQDIEVPEIVDGFRARIFGPNLVVVLVVVCRSLLPQMPPASPIEDQGTKIPIEDRDRAIPERLRLCGVTSRKDHSARETVGAGVEWISFAKDSFSRYRNRKVVRACSCLIVARLTDRCLKWFEGVTCTVSTPQDVALADANSGISMFDKVRVPRKVVRACSCLIVARLTDRCLKWFEGVTCTVSTPQDVALADANSGISMFDKILGLVQNISCFVFPHCNEASFIFGKEEAWQMAAKKDLKLIGEIPLEMKIREGSDEGVRVVVSSPGSVVSKAYEDLAQNVVNRLKELRDNPENEIQMKLNVPHSS